MSTLKLRRSLSEVFQRKKGARNVPGGLAPLAEIPEDEPAIPEDEPVFPSLQDDEIQYENSLQQAFVTSLRERNHDLEQERNASTNRVRHLEDQLRALAMDQQNIEAELARLHRDISRGRELETTRLQELQTMIQKITQEKDKLEEKDAQQIAELEQSLKEYQVYCVKTDEAHRKLQEKTNMLESENHTLSQSPDCAVAEMQKEKAKLMETVKALEADVSREKSAREAKNRAYYEARKQKLMKDVQNKRLVEEMTALHQKVEAVKAESGRQMAQELKEQQKRHEKEKEEASKILGNDLTPRSILIHKIFSQGSPSAADGGDQPNAAMFLQTCSPATLTNNLLDIRLNSQQARRFAESATVDGHSLVVCDLCQRPRFSRKPNANPRLRVNEFTKPSTVCCAKAICTECYLQRLTKSLVTDWWTNLGIKNWLKCPTPECGQHLPVSHREGLTNLLRQLGDKDVENNVSMYDRILTFRVALNRIHSPPSDDALITARKLHSQLMSVGRMRSFFDPKFSNPEPDDTGRIPPFRPGKIRLINVDQNGGSMQVPLFVRFLRRQRKPAECAVCTEELYDIQFGSPEEWLDLCTGFHGDWMWRILQFPVKLGQECKHDIDFCTRCLQRHLDTQLKQYGRSRCDQLACPADGCSRRLTYDEIRLYAEPTTFEEYDRYLNLNTLSRYPNFRWCLGPNCPSGQIYDDSDDGEVLDPHIHCQDCAFEMCYTHSMPWHEGQTCEQYDNVRQYGDPEFQQTQDWIAKNTKPCPNCKENIQKGELCFHMTCSSCDFEFCWECLADWSRISTGNGRHNASAHGEGCPFRTNGLTPTQVSGTNLQEVLGRRRH